MQIIRIESMITTRGSDRKEIDNRMNDTISEVLKYAKAIAAIKDLPPAPDKNLKKECGEQRGLDISKPDALIICCAELAKELAELGVDKHVSDLMTHNTNSYLELFAFHQQLQSELKKTYLLKINSILAVIEKIKTGNTGVRVVCEKSVGIEQLREKYKRLVKRLAGLISIKDNLVKELMEVESKIISMSERIDGVQKLTPLELKNDESIERLTGFLEGAMDFYKELLIKRIINVSTKYWVWSSPRESKVLIDPKKRTFDQTKELEKHHVLELEHALRCLLWRSFERLEGSVGKKGNVRDIDHIPKLELALHQLEEEEVLTRTTTDNPISNVSQNLGLSPDFIEECSKRFYKTNADELLSKLEVNKDGKVVFRKPLDESIRYTIHLPYLFKWGAELGICGINHKEYDTSSNGHPTRIFEKLIAKYHDGSHAPLHPLRADNAIIFNHFDVPAYIQELPYGRKIDVETNGEEELDNINVSEEITRLLKTKDLNLSMFDESELKEMWEAIKRRAKNISLERLLNEIDDGTLVDMINCIANFKRKGLIVSIPDYFVVSRMGDSSESMTVTCSTGESEPPLGSTLVDPTFYEQCVKRFGKGNAETIIDLLVKAPDGNIVIPENKYASVIWLLPLTPLLEWALELDYMEVKIYEHQPAKVFEAILAKYHAQLNANLEDVGHVYNYILNLLQISEDDYQKLFDGNDHASN